MRLNGFLLVDKPCGLSSFAVVKHAKSTFGVARAGHCGTLDPQASGLLVIALGKATRILPYLTTDPKAYSFDVQFGTETDTLDAAGETIKHGGRLPTESEIAESLSRFTGAVEQTPPRFSAVKVSGQRAYKLARQNKQFKLTPRTVDIFSISLDSYHADRGLAALTATCSKGTYIRSLARDMGAALGTYGYCASIRRTRIGNFDVKDAIASDNLHNDGSTVIPVHQACAEFTSIRLTPEQQQALAFGRDISLDIEQDNAHTVFAYDDRNNLVAVLKSQAAQVFHPERVFTT
ncbi:MAG: tRNA pseudouridine(55) synthase TruB [Chitinivibrionales bacterium]|nr:tRNA pseudouridine(55) synthase TruB [Chitinivibrionales bacterium]